MKTRTGNKKAGFSLVELLIVLAIIGILTSFLVVAIRGARRNALLQRSEAQFEKIRDILQNEVEDLLDQPLMVDVPFDVGTHVNFPGEQSFSRAERFKAEARRKLLLSRIPYHSSVIRDATALQQVVYRSNAASGSAPDRFFNFFLPQTLLTKYGFLRTNNVETLPANGSNEDNIASHNADSSEALYAVLSTIWIDDEPALSLFRDSEFGDTDGDGLIEIVDAFGQPVYFRLQMTLPFQDPADPTKLVNVNVPLDGISVWMTRVDIRTVDGQNLSLQLGDANTRTLDPDRVRVFVTSKETEPFDWNEVVPGF